MFIIAIGNTDWFRSFYKDKGVKVLRCNKDDAKAFATRDEAEIVRAKIATTLGGGVHKFAKVVAR